MTAINLIIFAVLIALTAFFVATEFAIVKVRATKIDRLILEGKKGAVSAKKVVTHLDEYLSTTLFVILTLFSYLILFL
ncbi:DUF21 domain-containing protein [Bacillus licheniformis]|nr:DUF21 domain-containing protein [Bacillus licheniformis]